MPWWRKALEDELNAPKSEPKTDTTKLINTEYLRGCARLRGRCVHWEEIWGGYWNGNKRLIMVVCEPDGCHYRISTSIPHFDDESWFRYSEDETKCVLVYLSDGEWLTVSEQHDRALNMEYAKCKLTKDELDKVREFKIKLVKERE